MISVENRSVIVVTGRTGSGKSVWSRRVSAGYQRRMIYDPFATYNCQVVDSEGLILLHESNQVDRKGFCIQFRDAALLPLAADICYSLGDCLLVVEEMGVVLNGMRATPDWLRRLIFLGRHRDVSLMLVAQRAASVPTDVRSQCSRFVAFAQSEFVDRDWIKKSFGPEVADRVGSLKTLHCIDIDLLTLRDFEYQVMVPGDDVSPGVISYGVLEG